MFVLRESRLLAEGVVTAEGGHPSGRWEGVRRQVGGCRGWKVGSSQSSADAGEEED